MNCAADEHSIILNAIRAQNSDKAKELIILHMKHIQTFHHEGCCSVEHLPNF